MDERPREPSAADTRTADRAVYERYLPLVRRIAMRTVRNVPSSVSFDDLVSAGWTGLVEALRRRGEQMPEEEFEAYASHRIRGSVLDYLRSLDPMSRKLRGASRTISSAIRSLTGRLGREPEETEVAGEIGISLETYHELLGDIAQSEVVRVELTDLGSASTGPEAGPEAIFSRQELIERVSDAISMLPERVQIVMGLYYQEDCNFREIGEILGVTEARICQIHTEAVHRIRARLESPDIFRPRASAPSLPALVLPQLKEPGTPPAEPSAVPPTVPVGRRGNVRRIR